MFLILFGIGFGAWKVLIDIQKLKIVPADSLPIIMSEMNLHSSEIIGEKKIKSYQLKDNEFGPISDEVSESIILEAPNVSFRDGPILNLKLEDIGVLGLNSTKLPESARNLNISRRQAGEMLTQNVDVGLAPEYHLSIAAGLSLSNTLENLNSKENYDTITVDKPLLSQKEENIAVNKVKTSINIFATNPSWIRINDKGSSIVFEKILKAGEVIEIKDNWFDGTLRAGNAKDLFFLLNGVTYGPVSDSRKVIKNFKIDAQNIFKSLKINDLKDSYLNSLLNNRRSF